MNDLGLTSVNNISRFLKCIIYKPENCLQPCFFSAFRNIIWRLKFYENANKYWRKIMKLRNSLQKVFKLIMFHDLIRKFSARSPQFYDSAWSPVGLMPGTLGKDLRVVVVFVFLELYTVYLPTLLDSLRLSSGAVVKHMIALGLKHKHCITVY